MAFYAKNGPSQESNPEPLTPKVRIIPLDHWAFLDLNFFREHQILISRLAVIHAIAPWEKLLRQS